jgi:hypothetical protein
MRKATWHYIIDVIQLVLAVLLGISSFLLWVIFPRGYFAARNTWVFIHKWSGLALGIMVVIHLVVHWKWLWQMTRRYLRGKTGDSES